jgi:hypothetical protein
LSSIALIPRNMPRFVGTVADSGEDVCRFPAGASTGV